jgi:hypothetical protein
MGGAAQGAETVSGCLFCGSAGERSKEHILRKQFKDFFPYRNEILVMQPRPSGVIDTETRPVSQFDLQLNAVCRACNQGWLNDLENEVLPLLLTAGRNGDDLHTHPDLMERLGFWAVLRALLRTHMSPEGRAPAALFRTAYGTRRPPRGCFAHWAYSQYYVAAAGVHHGSTTVGDNAHYVAHVSFGLGGTLFQVGLSGGSDWSRKLALKLMTRPQRWFPDSFYWIAPRDTALLTINPLAREAAFASINSFAIGAGYPILMDDASTMDPTQVIPARFHDSLTLPELEGVPLSYGQETAG